MFEEDIEEEMTDPEVYVEASVVVLDQDEKVRREMYGDHRRYRFAPATGHISGPLIADQPTETFLRTVETVVDYAIQEVGVSLREKTGERIKTFARVRKENQDDPRGKPDVKIMAEVVRCIDDPDRLDDLGF
ncbi:hypothetical protein [Haloferax sp. Atlit-4N]|uniref:hypothetical protein n=1 Tax=Haloferax sp. Atlit-4N TaxID=2077206 RepID=UPI0011C06C53|nr:hypothetical protein [Haloferax sp. Atlit-4N]